MKSQNEKRTNRRKFLLPVALVVVVLLVAALAALLFSRIQDEEAQVSREFGSDWSSVQKEPAF